MSRMSRICERISRGRVCARVSRISRICERVSRGHHQPMSASTSSAPDGTSQHQHALAPARAGHGQSRQSRCRHGYRRQA
jgi:hypothetical protein